MNRLLLIDTFNYVHRAYHALPKAFKDKDGNPTNAVYGFSSMLISTIDILKPTHVIAAFDELTQPTDRSKEFSAYKATRKETDQDLLVQLPRIEEIISAFGIQKMILPGYEADDIIGCVAMQAEKLGFDVIIVSNDKDILQLLSPHVRVFQPDSSKEGGKFFGVGEFREKYGFEPMQMVDYKALRGDLSDNIPGVFGIGEKIASDLIQKYTTVENLYEHINDIKPEGLKNKLMHGYESAVLSKRIATIVCDSSLKFDSEKCKLKEVNRAKAMEEFKKLNFKSLIRRMGFEVEGDKPKETGVDKSQLHMF